MDNGPTNKPTNGLTIQESSKPITESSKPITESSKPIPELQKPGIFSWFSNIFKPKEVVQKGGKRKNRRTKKNKKSKSVKSRK
jgi:hypothetical protein